MNKLTSSWDDLVFEYRHRDYGAYILRYNYPFNVTMAALIVLALFVSGMVGLKLFGAKGTGVSGTKITKIDYIDYVDLKAAPPIQKIELPKPAVAKYVAPKVIQEEVRDDEMMPTIEEVAAELEPVKDVIISPEFPGGTDALMKWLNENLRYPAIASLIGIEGKVVVEFTVDENGKISEVTVTESLHKVCDREAIRLVNAMPDWIPGSRNGGRITQKYILPIRFILT
jgi:protein TonB